MFCYYTIVNIIKISSGDNFMALKLTDGLKNNLYIVKRMNLPVKTAKRLAALGMTSGSEITMLNKKQSALIVTVRGTRFALGKAVAENIEIELKPETK